MTDVLAMWREVAAGFDQRLASVDVDDWARPTCCPEWTVTQLVEHAIGSQRFVPKALGASGDIDAEGDDLVAVGPRSGQPPTRRSECPERWIGS